MSVITMMLMLLITTVMMTEVYNWCYQGSIKPPGAYLAKRVLWVGAYSRGGGGGGGLFESGGLNRSFRVLSCRLIELTHQFSF